MGCDTIYGSDRNPAGTICGIRRGRPLACHLCGEKGHVLCDGCDKPVCRRVECAVSVPAIDLDYCQPCAQSPQITIQCPAASAALECRGPITKHGTCLQHEVVFDHWAKNCGGWANVYSRSDLDRNAKRARFSAWVAEHPRDVSAALVLRGMRAAPNNVIPIRRENSK